MLKSCKVGSFESTNRIVTSGIFGSGIKIKQTPAPAHRQMPVTKPIIAAHRDTSRQRKIAKKAAIEIPMPPMAKASPSLVENPLAQVTWLVAFAPSWPG
jgi:hypothetical protein